MVRRVRRVFEIGAHPKNWVDPSNRGAQNDQRSRIFDREKLRAERTGRPLSYVGISPDFAHPTIERRGKVAVRILQGRVQDFPYRIRSGSRDVINVHMISGKAFEHMNIPAWREEILRILRPGGIFYMTASYEIGRDVYALFRSLSPDPRIRMKVAAIDFQGDPKIPGFTHRGDTIYDRQGVMGSRSWYALDGTKFPRDVINFLSLYTDYTDSAEMIFIFQKAKK